MLYNELSIMGTAESSKILAKFTVVNLEKLEKKSKLRAIFWRLGRLGFYELSGCKSMLTLLYTKSIVGDMCRPSCTE